MKEALEQPKYRGLANVLTMSRLFLGLVALSLAIIAQNTGSDILLLILAILYSAGCLTDLLDGIIARQFQDQTEFGAFLDPVADKFLVVVGCMIAIYYWPHVWMLILSTFILSRELAVSVLRDWASRKGIQNQLSVIPLAKLNTSLKLTGLCLVLFAAYPDLFLRPVILVGGILTLAVSVVTSTISFAIYTKKVSKYMTT